MNPQNETPEKDPFNLFRSIYFTISGIFSVLLVLSIALTVLYSDYYHNDFSVQLADQLVEKVGTVGIDKTIDYLGEASQSAALIKNRVSVDKELLNSPESLESLMAGVLMTHSHLYSCYIGLATGQFYQVRRSGTVNGKEDLLWRESSFGKTGFVERRSMVLSGKEVDFSRQDTYDPRLRPWYQKASHEQRGIITDAYIFDSIDDLGITSAIPIYQNNKLIGVVGVDITLKEIGGFLHKLKLGSEARAFIVNDQQKILAYPDNSVFETSNGMSIPTLVDVENIELKEVFLSHQQSFENQQRNRNELTHKVIERDGQEYVVVLLDFVNLHGVNWTLVTYAPVQFFLGPIAEVRWGIMMGSTLILLIALGLSLGLSRYISRPIQKLAKKVEYSVAQDRMDFTVETKIPEIKVLSTALQKMQQGESKLLEVSQAISAEIQLHPLLSRVMEAVTDILDADRSTLFLYDEKTDELWSKVAEGLVMKEIRFPSGVGVAGQAFRSIQTINIRDAYNDERFNQSVDKLTGYTTATILCMPIVNKAGKPIGVVQALNKRDGIFNKIDERRLQAFSAQAVIAIENAQLFNQVVMIKNYNESMLESMTNGILTTDEGGRIVKANQSVLTLFGVTETPEKIVNQPIENVFFGSNRWIIERVEKVLQNGGTDESLDASLILQQYGKERHYSINLLIQPLSDANNERIGCLLLFEDISSEKRLRSTMARYMTKELADKLLADGEQALGGTLQTATVLFSDIRSFTTFSERNGPQETVQMLNAYFTEMYEQIVDNNGILDKYIGDAIMAVFGAPFGSSQDADNAVQSAIGMVLSLEGFNQKRVQDGREPIGIGIGINTGEVVSGNIGSEKRMDYTVIGDGVNLAARLEGATKAYGTSILISGSTKDALTKSFALREVDLIQVKGKNHPVSIYEVLSVLPAELLALRKQTLGQYTEGLALYRNQQWAEAISVFSSISEIDPQDPLAKMYMQRSQHFMVESPPVHWNGVWVMRSK